MLQVEAKTEEKENHHWFILENFGVYQLRLEPRIEPVLMCPDRLI